MRPLDFSSLDFSPCLLDAVAEALAYPMNPSVWRGVDEAIARGESVDGVGESGVSAIHFAAQKKDAKAVLELTARGANPNLRAVIEGETPLWFCSFFEEGDEGQAAAACIKALVKSGAKPDDFDAQGRPVIAEFFLFHPLLAAETLFKLGARLDAVDAKGQNLAHRWASEHRMQTTRDLGDALSRLDWLRDRSFSQGAPIDLNAWDAQGLSPLGIAVEGKHLSLALALILRDADPLRAAAPERLAALWKTAGNLDSVWRFPLQTQEAVASLFERDQLQAAMSTKQQAAPARPRAARL